MALVDTENLQVYYYYYTSGGIPNDVNDHCIRIPVPENVDYTAAQAIKADDGAITIVPNQEIVTARQWAAVRDQRNQMLAKCDWTQLADSHLSAEKKEAWADYRQALRDLPEEITDPAQVEWPQDPTQAPAVQASGSRLSSLLDAAQV